MDGSNQDLPQSAANVASRLFESGKTPGSATGNKDGTGVEPHAPGIKTSAMPHNWRAFCSCGWESRVQYRSKKEAQEVGIIHSKKARNIWVPTLPDDGSEHHEIYMEVLRDTGQVAS
jgi:hypothetical protein